jgi:threonine synthase
MWKAFEELQAMGLIDGRRPRMIAAQAEGCAPIVRAFRHRADASQPWEHAATIASGLRVPKPLGDFLILAGIYESGGEAVAAPDDELMQACRQMARLEGILAAPEGGAGLAAIQRLVASGSIGRDESIVLFNTGGGYKYLEAWQAALAG